MIGRNRTHPGTGGALGGLRLLSHKGALRLRDLVRRSRPVVPLSPCPSLPLFSVGLGSQSNRTSFAFDRTGSWPSSGLGMHRTTKSRTVRKCPPVRSNLGTPRRARGGGVRISCAQPYLVIYRTQTFASLQNRDTKHVEALPIRPGEVPRRDTMGGERFGCTLALWPEYTISDPIFH